MYTLVIGTREWSSWSLRPYLALAATGMAFHTEVVPLRRQGETRAAILRHSPSGKVPALKIVQEDRTITIWDSLAICETLAERHPGARLWPADPATRAIARSYACEMHSGFPDVRDQLSMVFTQKLPLPELREETQRQVARILQAWEEALAAYQGGFLFGGFSIADCMYAPVVSRFDSYGVAVPPAIRDYMDRILALPAMDAWRKGAQEEVAAGLA